MAEVAVPREFFQDILRVIAELRPPPDATPGVRRLTISVFERKRQETCALMAEKAEVCGDRLLQIRYTRAE